MNEFLAEYYGNGNDTDALEKMAQLTLLTKEAEEEGIDLSELSDEEVLQLADELYGNEDNDLEKEAAAKFEEADFLGRVMAHSMWQELDSIQKEAGVKDWLSSGWKGVKGFAKDTGRSAATTLRSLSPTGLGLRTISEADKAKLMTAAKKKAIAKLPMGAVDEREYQKAVSEAAKEVSPEIMRRARNRGLGIYGGAAGTAGLATVGGVKGVKHLQNRARNREEGREVRASALDTLIEQRALEHLASAGYVDQSGNVYGPEKTASADFDTTIDRAALELLEQNGYPVQWR